MCCQETHGLSCLYRFLVERTNPVAVFPLRSTFTQTILLYPKVSGGSQLASLMGINSVYDAAISPVPKRTVAEFRVLVFLVIDLQ